MEWTAAVGAIATLLVVLAKAWLAGKPEREQEKTDDEIQQGRQDLQDGNADAVAARIDRVLSLQEAGNGDAGSGGATGEEGDALTRRRLVDLGISVGQDPGKS